MAMKELAIRMEASYSRKADHVRKFPRVLAYCDACGHVHTFSRTGKGLVGYGCGTRKAD